MWGAGVPLERVMEPSDVQNVRPYLEAYAMVVKCKNLGLALSPADLDPQMLDYMALIQETIEEVNDRKRNKGRK